MEKQTISGLRMLQIKNLVKKYTAIIFAYILEFNYIPLILIFIVMKLAVWLSGIYTEEKYVESESRKEHGPYLANPYEDVDREAEGD